MTFDDEARTMTLCRDNMQFTELEPLTETDYIETAARQSGFHSHRLLKWQVISDKYQISIMSTEILMAKILVTIKL